ncbi:MAG: hypothetical protein R3F21_18490 [Myxococcota bacterium]
MIVAERTARFGEWNDPAGWSTNPIVPNNFGDTTFDVRIPPDTVVELQTDVVVDRLDLAVGSTLRGVFSETSITVEESMHWIDGLIDRGELLTTNGTTLVEGRSVFFDRWDYRNNGELTIAGATMRGFDSRFENSTTGVVRLEGEAPGLRFSGDGDGLVNDGLIVRTSGAGRAEIEGNAFVNRGTVDLQSGGLLLGDSSGSQIAVENHGRIQSALGTLLELGGFFQAANASTETAGDLLIIGGAIDGEVSVGGLLRTRGAVSFSADSQIDARSLEVARFSTTRFEGRALDLESLDLEGNLFVEGDLFVSGDFRWVGEVATSGVFRLEGERSMEGGMRGALENAGILVIGSNAEIAADSVLTNLAGAMLRTDDASEITGEGQIVNLGIHRHTAAAALDRELQVPYENRGAIEVESGSLDLVGALTGAGDVAIAAGARLSLVRSTQDILSSSARVSGAGELVIDSTSQRLLSGLDLSGALRVTRGAIEVAGPIDQLAEIDAGTDGTLIFSQPGLEIARGRIGGFQAGRLVANAPLTLTERLDWARGAIAGEAPVTLLGETLVGTGSGGGSATIDGTRVENAGTMTIDRAPLSLVGGGVLVNSAEGRVSHRSSFSGETIGGDGTGSILNDGVWTSRGNISVPIAFENRGRLLQEFGVLQLAGPGQSTGSIEVAADATLTLGGDFRLLPESSTSGVGTIRFVGTHDVGAGYQFDGATQLDFASQLNVLGAARLGATLSGGTVEVSSGARAGVVSSELFIRAGGDLEVERYAGARIELSEGGVVRAASDGTIAPTNLVGDGAIVGNTALTGSISPPRPPRFPVEVRRAATLSPGGGRFGPDAIGALAIDGDLSMEVANLVIELAGVEAGSGHDVVRVRDAANLGTQSILAVSVLGSFAEGIDASQSFSLLTAGAGIVGDFVNAPFGGRLATFDGSGSFLLDRVERLDGTTSIVLSDYRPIPEPGAALSMGIGLFLLATSGRRSARPLSSRKGAGCAKRTNAARRCRRSSARELASREE